MAANNKPPTPGGFVAAKSAAFHKTLFFASRFVKTDIRSLSVDTDPILKMAFLLLDDTTTAVVTKESVIGRYIASTVAGRSEV